MLNIIQNKEKDHLYVSHYLPQYLFTHNYKKIQLVSCYDSYFNETLLHNIKGLAAYRGQMTATKYAEAFELKWRTI